MAQKISQMTEQSTASMTEAGTSDFLGGYTTTGGNANRKFSLSGLANYFLNKFKMTLGGSSQTVKSAIDALNSNGSSVDPSNYSTWASFINALPKNYVVVKQPNSFTSSMKPDSSSTLSWGSVMISIGNEVSRCAVIWIECTGVANKVYIGGFSSSGAITWKTL